MAHDTHTPTPCSACEIRPARRSSASAAPPTDRPLCRRCYRKLVDAPYKDLHRAAEHAAARIRGVHSEDIAQEVAKRAWERSLAGAGKVPAAYWRRAARNLALDEVRARRPSIELDEDRPSPASSAEAILVAQATLEVIRAGASIRDWEIAVRNAEGDSASALARRFGSTPGAIHAAAYRVRSRARRTR